MKFLLLISCLLFSAEMEVDGNLKVTGTVDASGNAITNVGAALSMTDAINGNVLQSALRDDGVYEYKVYLTRMDDDSNINVIGYYEYQNGVNPQNNGNEWNNNFHNILISLLTDGWRIDNVIPTYTSAAINREQKNLYIFKRPISEDE